MSMRRRGNCAHVCALLVTVVVLGPTSARAQDEATLRASFEGTRVVVTVDMPGTSDGIDLGVSGERLLESQRYVQRLKTYGTAIHAGEQATITLVKVKKDLIEFQLNGGGFGTFGDDTSTSVPVTLVPKSQREKDLEQRVQDETNPRRRRELERELDEVRDPRERENRRIELGRLEVEDRKRHALAEKRLQGGSRFNLRYEDRVPRDITPKDVMTALGPYIVFGGRPTVEAPSGEATLRKGMSRTDAERLLGTSVSTSERQEGGLQVVTLVFMHTNERISADFIEDVLVRYRTASR